ncbi:GNA1162 family protein [Caballeronia sp. RCC_10]|uniref:GNA1162 family protein n=1 Tax=Caballeronia sp. RCC_10 TaxID=3239227 RepID=UPI0035239A3F
MLLRPAETTELSNRATSPNDSKATLDLRSCNELWKGTATANGIETRFNVGILVQCVAKQITNTLTEKFFDDAGRPSQRLLATGGKTMLPHCPPPSNFDADQTARRRLSPPLPQITSAPLFSNNSRSTDRWHRASFSQ